MEFSLIKVNMNKGIKMCYFYLEPENIAIIN